MRFSPMDLSSTSVITSNIKAFINDNMNKKKKQEINRFDFVKLMSYTFLATQ